MIASDVSSPSLSSDLKIRRLPWAIASGAGNAVFGSLTFGGSIFVLFLDCLGLPKSRIGVVLSLFPFCGLLAIPFGLVVGRFGAKRAWITCFALRNLVILLLILAPLVVHRSGVSSAATYVTAVMLVFAVLRAVGETGYYPWFREFCPDFIRGRFSAAQMIVTTICSAISLWIAGYVIGHSQGAGGFQILIAVGAVFGLASVAAMLRIPGGAPFDDPAGWGGYWRKVVSSLRHRDFRLYLCGMGLYLLGAAPFAFVPLFMRDMVGLSSVSVVRLETAALLGGVFSSFFVGRASDRYGGRRVLLLGTLALAVLPVVWLWMPRHSPWSGPLAYAAACWLGIAHACVGIGGIRLVFSEMIPVAKAIGYSSVYYAFSGLVGGIGPLTAGWALAGTTGLQGRLGGLNLDSYAPLFAVSVVLLLASVATYRAIGRTVKPPRANQATP